MKKHWFLYVFKTKTVDEEVREENGTRTEAEAKDGKLLRVSRRCKATAREQRSNTTKRS